MTNPDLYQILGVPPQATASTIRAAFRKKAKLAHPDAGGDPDEFRLLKLALDTLSDPESRAAYDATGDYAFAAPEPEQTDPRLHSTISDIFFRVISQVDKPRHQDIVALMRSAINDHLKHCADQIQAINILLSRIEVAIPQFHVRSGDNVLQQLATDRMEALRELLDTNVSDQQLYTQALHFLDSYSYDAEGYFKYVSIDP